MAESLASLVLKGLVRTLLCSARRLASADAPEDSVAELIGARGVVCEQGLDNGGLRAAIADDNQRRVGYHRHKLIHESLIELIDFASYVFVAVLLGFAMQPDYLRAVEDVELGEVAGMAVDFGDVRNVWA